MAADLIRFVDSIAASPTVRLNVNDEVTWWVKSFSAPPPRLRRSMSSNAMRDGAHMSASNYEPRTITIELEVRTSTQDATATAMQTLWRELDRESNYLMYQPTGATKPVFFKLYRSDAAQVEDVRGQAAMRTITVDLLAEPFFLGLKETLGPYTVTNNPTVATAFLFDLPTVLGDVSAPLVVWDDQTVRTDTILTSTHSRTTGAPLVWSQAESLTLGTDTTNPGGGPDAAMSGTGVNNYVRTSFATAALSQRLQWTIPTTARGRYRLVAFTRASAGSTFTIGHSLRGSLPTTQPTVEKTFLLAGSTATDRSLLDLGVIDLSSEVSLSTGYSSSANSGAANVLYISASRDSGAATLDWDLLALIPCGGQTGEFAPPSTLMYSGVVGPVVDSIAEIVLGNQTAASDPTLGASTISPFAAVASGSFPYASPGAANRIFMLRHGGYSSLIGDTTSVRAAYWPRYLHVRPSAS